MTMRFYDLTSKAIIQTTNYKPSLIDNISQKNTQKPNFHSTEAHQTLDSDWHTILYQ